MEKQLKLVLLQIKDDKFDAIIKQRNEYRMMSTFLSPRDVHQIINYEDEKYVTGNSDILKSSKNQEEGQRLNSQENIQRQNNDYAQDKIQVYFDKKMQEDIQRSVGQPISKQKNSAKKKEKGMTNIIMNMKDSMQKCQMAKQLALKEVQRMIKYENEEQFRSRPSSSQLLAKKKLNMMLSKSNNSNISSLSRNSRSRINVYSPCDSQMSVNDTENKPTQYYNNNHQRSKMKILLEEEYQLNGSILNRKYSRINLNSKQNEHQSLDAYKNDIQMAQQISSKESQSNKKSPNPKILVKTKSAFHQLYKKRGTIEPQYQMPQVQKEMKQSSIELLPLADTFDSDDTKKMTPYQRKTTLTPEYKNGIRPMFKQSAQRENLIETSLSDINNSSSNSINSEKSCANLHSQLILNSQQHFNSQLLDAKVNSGISSPKRNSQFYKGDKFVLSSQNFESAFKRQANPLNQKIQFLQQMSGIVGDVENVCTHLIDDAKLFQKSTHITQSLNQYKDILQEKKQMWLENPTYRHTKQKLMTMQDIILSITLNLLINLQNNQIHQLSFNLIKFLNFHNNSLIFIIYQ